MPTNSTIPSRSQQHFSPAASLIASPASARSRQVPQASVHPHKAGPHSASRPAAKRSACSRGNARPSLSPAPRRCPRPRSSKSRATPVRSSTFSGSLPRLVPLLERQPAEPALLPSGGQQIAEHQPRPQQPRLHRSHRDAQRFGGLLNVQMFHVTQHKHFAILPVESTQCFRQPLPYFLALQRFGWNLAPVSEIPRRIFAFFIARARTMAVYAFHHDSSLPSPAHQGFIHRDLDQPRAESRLRPELPDIRKSLQHRFLRRILSIMLVPQNRESRRVNPPFIRPHQFVKQLMLPPLHAQNQILLARAASWPRVVQHYAWLGHPCSQSSLLAS